MKKAEKVYKFSAEKSTNSVGRTKSVPLCKNLLRKERKKMGKMKELHQKLREGLPLTKAERRYLNFIKKNNGEKDDYLYQESLRDIKQLEMIDPPDEKPNEL